LTWKAGLPLAFDPEGAAARTQALGRKLPRFARECYKQNEVILVIRPVGLLMRQLESM
jgi:hypothetical protein